MRTVISFIPLFFIFASTLALSCDVTTAYAVDSLQDSTKSLYKKTIQFSFKPDQAVYQLPDRFVVLHTDLVSTDVGTPLLRNIDYEMDYERGQLSFFRTQRPHSVIHVSYEIYPIALQNSYIHRRMVIEHVLPDTQSHKTTQTIETPSVLRNTFSGINSSLDVTGSKTFSVLTGSHRDASLGQSLRIRITGKAAENVDIVAILSDKSSPIQPEGNTRKLQELDNVLVQVKTPNMTTTMGDYTLNFDKSILGRYNRKLKGVQSHINTPNGSFQLAAAVSDGKYTTNRFQGVEGNQGPYELTGETGDRAILVVAGTERVWVDGKRMVRGEDQDYAIDYTSAQITFTRNRLVTGDSRIVVDFEASDQQYRRNLYIGRGEMKLGEHIAFGTTFIRESDDRAAYQNFGLQPPGVSRKPNEAEQETVNSASQLPLPTSQSLLAFDVRSTPINGVSVTGEFAFSGFDEDIQSNRPQQRARHGNAFLIKTDIAPRTLSIGRTSLGDVSASGVFRNVQRSFNPAGRLDQAEYHRRYGQDALQSWRGQVMEFNGSHAVGEYTRFTGGWGRMSRADGFLSNRRQVGMVVTPTRSIQIKYDFQEYGAGSERQTIPLPSSNSEQRAYMNRWRRNQFRGSFDSRYVKPFIGVLEENQIQHENGILDAGQYFREVSTGFESVRIGNISLLSSAAFRTTSVVGPTGTNTRDWRHESTARTLQQSIALQEWRSLTMSARMINRRRLFKEVDGTDNTESLIDGRVAYSPWRRAISMDMRYEVNNTSSARTNRRYVRVGRGRGNLRFDDLEGEYIPDSDGEYIAQYDNVGTFEPVTGVKASFRFQSQMYRKVKSQTGALGALLRNVSSDTYIAVDEQSKSNNRKTLYLLNLNQFQQDSTTVLGSMNLRHDMFLFPKHRRISVRLRYQRLSTMNNQLITGGEHRYKAERSVRVRASLTPKTVTELTFARASRRRTDSGRERFRIISNNGFVTLSHRPTQPLELFIKLVGGYDKDRLHLLNSSIISIVPRVTYSFRGKGRARLEVDWANVQASRNAALPFEMVNGRRRGNSGRWHGSLDYRIGQNVSMLINYDGRTDPQRSVVHTARAEVRAFF